MSPLKIVIADDHAAVRKSLRLILECEQNVEIVAETVDGLETIRTVQALQPDLLLLDIKMPQMSGLEVLQYLRNARHTLGIVILSNHSEQLYIAAAKRLGADAFIAKGAGLEALTEAVQKIRQRLHTDRMVVPPYLAEADPARLGCLLTETRADLEKNQQEWSEAS